MPPSATVPPQNIEAEESVLGAMLVAEPALTRVIDEVKLNAADFYLDRHRAIFEAIHALYAQSKPVDELSVSEELIQHNKIDEAGGKHYVSELAAKVPAAGNARHYAEIVQQNSLLRRLLGAGQEIQGWVNERAGEPRELSERAEKLLADIRATDSTAAEPAAIVTAQEFAAVEEPGSDPLLGEPGQAVIPEGGDVVIYGDGGASKTTLSADLAMHLAAGDPWIGIPTPRPASVLMIEAEGPRPLFRQKVRGKLESWRGSDIGDRLVILEEPWADFRFADGDRVARLIAERGIDVLIVGPLTRVGMEELGTLQEVRDFLAGVDHFRLRTGRRLTVILVHHENKAGAVSGAWEGATDTLLHATVHAPGRTTLHVAKARWASEHHKRTLELVWTPGEGFALSEDEDDRDHGAEIAALLADGAWRTATEIADGVREEHGAGLRREAVEGILRSDPQFAALTGRAAKEVGRHPNATVWGLAPRSGQDGQDTVPESPDMSRLASCPPLKGARGMTQDETRPSGVAPDPGQDAQEESAK